jgi:hypothetical protein
MCGPCDGGCVDMELDREAEENAKAAHDAYCAAMADEEARAHQDAARSKEAQ